MVGRRNERKEEVRIYKDGIGNFKPWGGATDTWEKIENENRLDDLERELEDLYPDGLSETGLNDLLRYDPEWVLGLVGIEENDDETE